MNKILWNSINTPLRYFWVPVGEDVLVGEYAIENGDGEEFSVELESLIPFEISGEEAEAIMMRELEDMTNELGGLFKGLFNLGKRMINSELMDEDSEDWDSEDESDVDSEEDSEDGLDDDMDKIIRLFDDEDSDFDSEEDSEDGTLEELIAQFGDDLEGPLMELKDLITKEVGNLGTELDKLGAEAAANIDAEPEAGQDILRELGQWLINLADERDADAEESSEEVVVMEFRPKSESSNDNAPETKEDDTTEDDATENDTETNLNTENNDVDGMDADSEDSSDDDSEESSESSSESSESTPDTDTDIDTSDTEHTEDNDIEQPTEESTKQTSSELDTTVDESSNSTIVKKALPSPSALKRLTKAELVALGEEYDLTLTMKDTKQTLLEQLETLR